MSVRVQSCAECAEWNENHRLIRLCVTVLCYLQPPKRKLKKKKKGAKLAPIPVIIDGKNAGRLCVCVCSHSISSSVSVSVCLFGVERERVGGCACVWCGVCLCVVLALVSIMSFCVV